MNSLSWTFVGKLDSQNDLAGAMLTQNGLPKSQSKSLLLEHTDGDGQCPKMSVKLHQDWVFFSPVFGVILIQIYLKDNCIISICSIISYSFIIYPTFFWPQKLLFLGQLVMSMVQTLIEMMGVFPWGPGARRSYWIVWLKPRRWVSRRRAQLEIPIGDWCWGIPWWDWLQ